MPFPKVEAQKRFIPNLKDVTDFRVEQEIRRLWAGVFGVQDASLDVLDQTLTKNTLLDRDLVAGKMLLFIFRQDTVGGHAVQFQTLKDGSLKFKGMSFVGLLDTTPNTFTSLLFYATSADEALLVNVTGGNLV